MSTQNSKDTPGSEKTESFTDKAKSSWEFRTGKIILRVAFTLFFVSYLALSLPMAWQWAWSAYYKSQPLSHLDTLIAENMNSPDQSQFMSWVHLRPEHEHDEIQQKLEPLSAKLDPFFFLLFSQWSAKKLDIEKTVFWHFYARYRLRFDALRCGAPDSVQNVDGVIALMPEGHITATVQRWPQLIPMSIHDVLEFDAKYPAANNPARICRIVYEIEGKNFAIVKQADWQAIRHTLRARTELSLSEMMRDLEQRRQQQPKKDETPAAGKDEGKDTE